MSEIDLLKKPLLARQAILDLNENIFGYELLFRDESGKVNFSSPTQATANVLQQWMTQDITKISEKSFINVNEEILSLNFFDTIAPNNLVIEVLETCEITPNLLRRIKELKDRGFTIAIDDFDCSEKSYNQFRELFPIADIIKIEIPALNNDYNSLIQLRKCWDKQLLAEKVEDQPTYAICRRIGVELYQGYYFARPEIINGIKLDPETDDLLSVIAQFRLDMDMDELEKLFKSKSVLIVSLLKYVNSASLNRGNEIHSLRHALGLLGRKQIFEWLFLLLAAKASRNQKSTQIFVDQALLHANLCESLYQKLHGCNDKNQTDQAYLCGLLTQMPLMLSLEPIAFYERLNLTQEMTSALLHHQGKVGECLKLAQDLINPSTRWQINLPLSITIINDLLEKAWQASSKTRE